MAGSKDGASRWAFWRRSSSSRWWARMAERMVTIVNKNGLHARPAAEIVKTAAKFTSDIVIVRDDLEVNGKSIMGVLMLAAECGSTITAAGLGPGRSGGRRRHRGPHQPASSGRSSRPMDRIFVGVPASPGIVVGPVHLLRWEVPRGAAPHHRGRCDPAGDRATCTTPSLRAKERLAAGARAGRAARGPRRGRDLRRPAAHAQDDASLHRRGRVQHPAELRRREGVRPGDAGAPASSSRVMRMPRMRERAGDLTDVHIRVLLRPPGSSRTTIRSMSRRAPHAILVTHDLTPSLTVQLDRDAIAGIATDAGTRTSHVAILARSLGLPAVLGLARRDEPARRRRARRPRWRGRRARGQSHRIGDRGVSPPGAARGRGRGGAAAVRHRVEPVTQDGSRITLLRQRRSARGGGGRGAERGRGRGPHAHGVPRGRARDDAGRRGAISRVCARRSTRSAGARWSSGRSMSAATRCRRADIRPRRIRSSAGARSACASTSPRCSRCSCGR